MDYPSTARFFIFRDTSRPPILEDNTGLKGSGPDVLEYMRSLKVGEEVIETSHSAMEGNRGIVYLSKDGGGNCVMWNLPANRWQGACKMGTSITWGTRRVSDMTVTPSRILEIMYRGDLNKPAREFAHTWEVKGWGPKLDGTWTFNRSDVAIANEWWPAIYNHASLQSLLDHLEETFVEGVPANVPD